MNNATLTRTIIIFVVGAGAGFLAGKMLYEEKYKQLAQEEINSVKEVFGRRGYMDDSDPEELPIKEGRTGNTIGALTRSSLELTRSNPYEDAKRNYSLTKADLELPDGPEEEVIEVDRDRPYTITAEEFTEEFDHHDKLSLCYYRVDDVLTSDGDNDIIENVEEVVGIGTLSAFDSKTTTSRFEKTMLWVRNEVLGSDFEIVAINRAFGPGEESPKEKHKKNSKKGRSKKTDVENDE